MTSFWPVLDRFHEQPHTHNQIHFWTLHPREVLPRHEDPHRSRPQTLSNPVQIILHFHISLTQMQRKKKNFITIPTIEPSHYRWHPTTKRTGFSHSISPCQKILFRNHHLKYSQNPPPLPWHPSPQNLKALSSRTDLPIVMLHLPEGRNFSKSVQDCWHILLKMTQLHSIWHNHPIPTYHKTESLKDILVHFCQAKPTSLRSAPHEFCQ